jgi:hypothetical protein
MFSATQTLDDASGDDVSYVLIKQDGTGTVRLDTATSLAAPSYLSIKHSTNGKGNSAVDRHLVQIAKTVDSTPEPVTLVCNFTLQVPRDSAVTSQIVYDVVANLIDFLMAGGLTTLTTTTIDGLLRGES